MEPVGTRPKQAASRIGSFPGETARRAVTQRRPRVATYPDAMATTPLSSAFPLARFIALTTDPAADPAATASAEPTASAEATATAEATPTAEPTTFPADETTEAVVEATLDLLTVAWHAALGALVGLVIALTTLIVLGHLGRRRSLYAEVVRFARMPLYVFAGVLGGYLGVQIAIADVSMSVPQKYAVHAILIGVILSGTWVLVRLVKAAESSIVIGVAAGDDVGRANRVTTQTQIMRRVIEAVIIVCGLVGAIMTFPSARIAMGSLLASAGLISVVAGLAAQSTLSNVFAGVQLASTDAIRVDDTVVVNGEQGFIEEITLTYVVVRSWDDRRIIYPSSYFTQNPFANWSRRGTEHTGTLTIDLDWRVPVQSVREQVEQIVEDDETWDKRSVAVDVTDTSGGTVTLRVALSGANPADVFTLSCHVREQVVGWLQREHPEALPRTRVLLEPTGAAEPQQ